MQHNGQFTVELRKSKEAPLAETAMRNAGISFLQKALPKGRPIVYVCYPSPEIALRNAGFFVWGERDALIIRIRAVLRKEKNV